jgi:hypothetical protein
MSHLPGNAKLAAHFAGRQGPAGRSKAEDLRSTVRQQAARNRKPPWWKGKPGATNRQLGADPENRGFRPRSARSLHAVQVAKIKVLGGDSAALIEIGMDDAFRSSLAAQSEEARAGSGLALSGGWSRDLCATIAAAQPLPLVSLCRTAVGWLW